MEKQCKSKHKERTICQRVKIVWLYGRREYVSQLPCNFINTDPFLAPLLIWKKILHLNVHVNVLMVAVALSPLCMYEKNRCEVIK